MPRCPFARSGMALILTLAAIVLAGGVALFLQARSSALGRVERTELVRERLRVAAAEAARDALRTLASDEDLQVDHLGEEWALPRETIQDDGVSTRALIEDAGRYYNWNNLAVSNRATRTPHDILLDLLTFCGDFSPMDRVDALRDFVDADGEGRYEADFYGRQARGAAPANRILWAPGELRHVHGFSGEVFLPRPRTGTGDLFGGQVSQALVLVPAALQEPLPVNVNTASREVLMGLTGLQQESMVRTVLALRQVQPFESLGVMFMASPELAAALEGAIGTSSQYFRVQSRASLEGQSRTVMAWVRRDERGDIQILQWIEGEG